MGKKTTTSSQSTTADSTTNQNQSSINGTLSNQSTNSTTTGNTASQTTGTSSGSTSSNQTGSSAGTSTNNQTSTVSKWSGANADTANQLLGGLTSYFKNLNGTSGSAGALDAYNNGTYSTPLNDVQLAAYKRAQNTINNTELNNIAGGSGLDLENDATFQKNLQSQIGKLQKAFATSVDSANSSFQNGGTADSSMRYRTQQNMLDDYSTNTNDYITKAYAAQRANAINEMVTANSLLDSAASQGNTYQALLQQAKDGSLSTYMKMIGLDSSNANDVMQYLSLISEPTTTTSGTGTNATTSTGSATGTTTGTNLSNTTGTSSSNTLTDTQLRSLALQLAEAFSKTHATSTSEGTQTQSGNFLDTLLGITKINIPTG